MLKNAELGQIKLGEVGLEKFGKAVDHTCTRNDRPAKNYF
jgi:hypothetical protein